jgi:hypothetical protein
VSVLRKLRLHLEQRDGTIRVAAQLMFTARDASLYLVPYAARGEYFYGEQTFAPGQRNAEIKFREQVSAKERPKLSIHATGAVHIYSHDAPKVGPVHIPPLHEYRGEHLATVSWDRIDLVPVHTGRMSTTGEQRDYAFRVPEDVKAGDFLLYANGVENRFLTEYVHFAIQAWGAEGAPPVYFGVTAAAQEPKGEAGEGGVTVLAGFNARQPPEEEAKLLFLRGL